MLEITNIVFKHLQHGGKERERERERKKERKKERAIVASSGALAPPSLQRPSLCVCGLPFFVQITLVDWNKGQGVDSTKVMVQFPRWSKTST